MTVTPHTDQDPRFKETEVQLKRTEGESRNNKLTEQRGTAEEASGGKAAESKALGLFLRADLIPLCGKWGD